LAGRIVVAGGFRADGGTVATVEIFATGTGVWRRTADLPLPVNHAMAATAGGSVFVFGGYRADGSASPAAWRLGDGDRWTPIADLPEARAAGTAVAVGDRVYVAGGIGPAKDLATSMLVYDVKTGDWSTAPGPPTRREHLGGAATGGQVYTIGGRTGAGNLDAVESYDPASGQWRARPALPTARGGLAAAATCTGHLVAAGGEGSATFPQVELFDPAAGRWSALPPMLTPRHGLGVVTVGPRLYTLLGGPQPGLHVAAGGEVLDLTSLGACPAG